MAMKSLLKGKIGAYSYLALVSVLIWVVMYWVDLTISFSSHWSVSKTATAYIVFPVLALLFTSLSKKKGESNKINTIVAVASILIIIFEIFGWVVALFIVD